MCCCSGRPHAQPNLRVNLLLFSEYLRTDGTLDSDPTRHHAATIQSRIDLRYSYRYPVYTSITPNKSMRMCWVHPHQLWSNVELRAGAARRPLPPVVVLRRGAARARLARRRCRCRARRLVDCVVSHLNQAVARGGLVTAAARARHRHLHLGELSELERVGARAHAAQAPHRRRFAIVGASNLLA